MTYNIIATGSTGNAVVINGQILIDCGVPFFKLAEFKKDLKLVLLSHVHGDHFKPRTVAALHRERPTLRWACCEWMVGPLLEAGVDKRVIDVFQFKAPMFYAGIGIFEPVPLVHDAPNCGWDMQVVSGSIAENNMKSNTVIYATDTGSLDGISAPGYDYYLIEANHTEAEIAERIRQKEEAREFCYEYRARKTHLSREKAVAWLKQNMDEHSRCVFLHQHKERSHAKADN